MTYVHNLNTNEYSLNNLNDMLLTLLKFDMVWQIIWRPPSLGELTPIIFYTELTYLGSEATN